MWIVNELSSVVLADSSHPLPVDEPYELTVELLYWLTNDSTN